MCMINSHSSAVFLRLSNSTRLFPASASRHRAPPFSNCTIVLLQQLVDSATCLPFDIYNFPSITTRTTNCNEWSALCNNFCSANIKTSIKIMIFRYFQQFSFFFPFPSRTRTQHRVSTLTSQHACCLRVPPGGYMVNNLLSVCLIAVYWLKQHRF